MFQYYDITLVGLTEVTLTYELNKHRPAQVWADLMRSVTIDSLRPTLNPWRDFDRSILKNKVDHLHTIIDKLNLWLPDSNKITGVWDYNDHQKSVNRFHIHFPEQEKTETDIDRRNQLAEYNDVIHEIELLTHGLDVSKPRLLICPDGYEYVPFIDDDYKLFTARRFFGELCLHYCHVGRHPFELLLANDTDCPIEQIVPQNRISPLHTLRFYTDPNLEHYYKPIFKQFYENSTLKKFIDFKDPKMAFGYITMGKLVSSNSEQEVLESVSKCSSIKSFKIY